MIILAIESSSYRGGLAVMQDGEPRGDVVLSESQRTAQLLAPALDQLLQDCQLTAGQVDVVTVTVGPGVLHWPKGRRHNREVLCLCNRCSSLWREYDAVVGRAGLHNDY